MNYHDQMMQYEHSCNACTPKTILLACATIARLADLEVELLREKIGYLTKPMLCPVCQELDCECDHIPDAGEMVEEKQE